MMEENKCEVTQTPDEFQLSQGVATEGSIRLAREKLVECYHKLIILHEHYLDWSLDEIKLQVIWDIATYFHKEFSAFPYRFINAAKSSGKSRLLGITKAVAWNAELTAGMTDSVLFRSAAHSTLIFDEAESITSKDKKNQRLILNAGYKKGASIKISKEIKIDGKKDFAPVDYPVYGPKMLANIIGMEEVLGSRCILSIMEKSANPGKVRLLEDFENHPFFQEIKRTLEKVSVVLCRCISGKNGWEQADWNAYITQKYPTQYTHNTYTYISNINIHQSTLNDEKLALFSKIDEYGIDGRNLELFFPLFMTAHRIGDEVLSDILRIAGSKVKEKKETDLMASKDIAVIEFVARQPEQKQITYTKIKDLTREFSEFYQDDEPDVRWLTPHWFGNALYRLNLITSKKRMSQGMEVTLDIPKAQEKLKIFK